MCKVTRDTHATHGFCGLGNAGINLNEVMSSVGFQICVVYTYEEKLPSRIRSDSASFELQRLCVLCVCACVHTGKEKFSESSFGFVNLII